MMNKGSRDSSYFRRGVSVINAMKERDDDLALFHEMRKREKERNSSLLLPISDEFEPALGTHIAYELDFGQASSDSSLLKRVQVKQAASKMGSSPIYKIPASTPMRKGASDEFLTTDGDKNDYDWLLTPPGTPLFPSLEMEAQAAGFDQRPTPVVRPLTVLKTSRLSNSQSEPSSKIVRGSLTSRQATLSSGLSTSANASSRKPSATTPTAAVSSRPSTPTARSTVSASKSSSRSSTRSSTPVRRSSAPTLSQNSSAPPGRSSSVSKASTMPARNPAPSRGTSPSVRPRPLQPSSIPGFSLETPPNLRTSMPERPVSANRGRPGAPSSARSTTETPTANKPRRQSCSPSVTRGRIANDSHNSDRSNFRTSKSHGNGTEGAVPVVLGSKMVEKVMNARRSVSQGQEDQATTRSITSTMQAKRPVKSISSQDSTGFGRTLSKKSLDMALRHMDIRRSTPTSFRPHMTNIPTSSLYSVRSGAIKSKPTSISDSPIATSSNASSEYSASIAPDPEGSEFDDEDFGNGRGSRASQASQQNNMQFKGNVKSTNWLHSPTYSEDKNDHTLFFDQGFEILSDPMDDIIRTRSVGVGYDSKIGVEYLPHLLLHFSQWAIPIWAGEMQSLKARLPRSSMARRIRTGHEPKFSLGEPGISPKAQVMYPLRSMPNTVRLPHFALCR
eukprot:Gb_23581 [translate_table: standard]